MNMAYTRSSSTIIEQICKLFIGYIILYKEFRRERVTCTNIRVVQQESRRERVTCTNIRVVQQESRRERVTCTNIRVVQQESRRERVTCTVLNQLDITKHIPGSFVGSGAMYLQ